MPLFGEHLVAFDKHGLPVVCGFYRYEGWQLLIAGSQNVELVLHDKMREFCRGYDAVKIVCTQA